ncbi:MAG: DUF3134 domain-containing protein [Microcoleaceae cyanobacterium]
MNNPSLNNPSLIETPVHEPADVIPTEEVTSLLGWLKSTGRLIARDVQEQTSYLEADQEISDLIVDESSYEDEEDDSEEVADD